MSRNRLPAFLALILLIGAAGAGARPATRIAAQIPPPAGTPEPSGPHDPAPWRPAIPADFQIKAAPNVLPPVLTGLTVVNLPSNSTVPNFVNTDTIGGTEPSIAVNPANTNQIVIGAGFGGWGGNAPLWETSNGGQTWTKRNVIPVPTNSGITNCPCDQTFDYGRSNRLFGTFLAPNPNGNIWGGGTTDPTQAASWVWPLNGSGNAVQANSAGLNNSDQPWILVTRNPGNAAQDDVYIAYDDFTTNPVTMRVAVARGTFAPSFVQDQQSGTTGGPINPGHRLAVDPRNGTVYSVFGRSPAAGDDQSRQIEYRLNRSTDGGNTWTLNGNAAGIIVATADSDQPRPKFGTVNALLGGVHHAAVDPTNGDLYYAYGNRDAATNNNRLSVARLVTDTNTGNISVSTTSFLTGQVQAALPSVAVTQNGIVGVLFTTFDGMSPGPNSFPTFTAHFSVSTDKGVTWQDTSLSTFLASANDDGLGNASRQRLLGDYQMVKAVGNTFFGAFTGNRSSFGASTSVMDPSFFKVTVTAAPALTTSFTSPATSPIGQPFQYTFRIRNTEALPAENSSVRFTLPPGLMPVSPPTTNGGVCQPFSGGGTQSSCTFGSLPPNMPADIVVTISVRANGPPGANLCATAFVTSGPAISPTYRLLTSCTRVA